MRRRAARSTPSSSVAARRGWPPPPGWRATAARWWWSTARSTAPAWSSARTATSGATRRRPVELLARGPRGGLRLPDRRDPRPAGSSAVRRRDGRAVRGRRRPALPPRLVLACGVRDAFPEVEGFDTHYGASVFHCPACDGYEARDRDVVALGWDPHLVGFSATLLNWARSVTVVTNGHRFQGDESLPRGARRATATSSSRRTPSGCSASAATCRGWSSSSGRVLPTSLVFFSVAHEPAHRARGRAGLRDRRRGLRRRRRRGADERAGRLRRRRPHPGAAAGAVRRGRRRGRRGRRGAVAVRHARARPTSPRPAPDPTEPGQGG